MTNWTTYKLGEISSNISYGYTESAKQEKIGPKFLRITDIQNDHVDWDTVPYCKITPKDFEKYKLEIGDIVIARTGNSTGATSTIKDDVEAVYASYLIRYRLDQKKANPFFVDYILRSNKWQLFVDSIKGGSAQPGANAKQLAEFEVNLPDLTTQRRIAEILSALDDKIELNRRMNQTLEQMAQTLFRQYFVDGIDEENLPEGWSIQSLGGLVEITSSKRIFLNDYVPEGVPFYRGKEIIQLNKTGIISTELFITEDKFNTINAKFGVPKEGDILLTSVGTIGVPYLVNKDDEFYFKDGNITWIKSYFKYINSFYLYQWLISEVGQSSINNITIGSTQKAVTIQSLKTMQVMVPPKELHDKACNQIEALRSKITHNIKEIRTLIQIRDSLLPNLISGKIDVMQTQAHELHEPVLS